MHALYAAVCLLFAGAAMPASADVVTDGSVGSRVRLDGDFEVGADLGTRAGRNLFHSFERFSLDTGERATFSGPDQIRNVISRVTGGARSDIDGTIRSTIPGADFYLINPAGIAFGPNARLDLEGSFHVSTADELRFVDGATFSAGDPASSSFSVAAPQAFGFLGSSPRAITVERSSLAVPAGEALSVIGGEITIDGGNAGAASGGEQGLVRAEAGQITLAAAGGPGEARLSSGDMTADEAAAITLVDQAVVDASGDGGGTIRIRGGAFLVDNATMVADNTGEQAGGGGLEVRAGVAHIWGGRLTADARAGGPAGSVRLVADRLKITDGGRIDSNSLGAGPGGSIALEVGRLELLRDGARVAAATFGPGPAGDLSVDAREILAVGADPAARNPSGLFASSLGGSPDAGDGGSIVLNVGRLELREGAQVAAVTRGPGAAGNLTVNAQQIIATAPQAGSGIPSGLFANSLGDSPDAGDGGSIVVDVDRLELRGGGQVFSGTFGPGDGGDATVVAGDIVAAGADATTGFPSGIFAGSEGAGDAGNVRVSADRLTLLDGGKIFSSPTAESTGAGGKVRVVASDRLLMAGMSAGGVASGIFATSEGAPGSDEDAGDVAVRAGELEIRDGVISSSTFTAGNAGKIEVTADAFTIRNDVGVSSSTFAEGDAGTVTVSAGRLRLLDGGQIISSPLRESTGAGGEVRVAAADTLLIAGRNPGGVPSGIFASAEGARSATKNAGDVTVTAGALEIRDGGVITSSTLTAGHAGTVEVTANALTIRNGSDISSRSFAEGNAGIVTVSADRLMLLDDGQISSSPLGESTGAGGTVRVTASETLLIAGEAGGSPSGIFASVEGARDATEDAGDVMVTAGALMVRDGGLISSSTLSAGNAGKVTVDAERIEFVNDGRIFNGTNGAGDGGDITVRAKTILADVGSNPTPFHTGISASANPVSGGEGGDVMVTADRIRLINRAEISSDTESSGAAGAVTISAKLIELRDGGRIFTTSSSSGDAGSIVVAASRLEFDGGRINTDTASAGGGEIQLRVGDVIDLRHSAVTTSVAGGADPTAGNILIDPKVLIIDGSRIQADAPRGFGGQVRIVADNILVSGGDFDALLARGDISASGGDPSRAGNVVVSAPEVDLAGGLVVLEGALLDAAAQLRERCGARRDVGASSFTGVGRGGLPPSPDGPLAGAYLGAAPSDGGPVALTGMAAPSARRSSFAPCLGAP
jgi:filamentous hemagglutinin family protein